ncbi:hypothetical protein [Wolbachia endosymbiont of Drosophila innubila]|uniref:hypothetical protein n=1 Tax=Wolbachia endosymbiont of Drosophila innubila TaxID=282263 RepID=UPI001F398330|nr:hypothetical protein [Wolbachia endosymbiont of Drosophila innubila]
MGKRQKKEKWKNLSFGKQKEAVKKLIKNSVGKRRWNEVCSESEEKFIPMNLKKKGTNAQ